MAALSFIKKALPWLGTVAGIVGVPGAAPIVAIATKLLSTHLGQPVAVGGLAEAITTAFGDPDKLAALKAADQAFQQAMQQMGYQHESDMEAIAEKDRENARNMQVQTRSLIPGMLAVAVTLGFFGLLAFMCLHSIPDSSRGPLNIMLGSLGTAWVTIIAFYFGSSQGSERKTELLAQ